MEGTGALTEWRRRGATARYHGAGAHPGHWLGLNRRSSDHLESPAPEMTEMTSYKKKILQPGIKDVSTARRFIMAPRWIKWPLKETNCAQMSGGFTKAVH